MATRREPRAQRALRLASGVALSLAISYAMGLELSFIAPIFALFLLAKLNSPLSFKAGLGLTLVVMLTTGSGLLLIPLLRYAPFSGVLLVGLCLFLAFRHGLRGGNGLITTFLVVGLTMISAAGTAEFALALKVISALAQGLLLAVLILPICHLLFPEAAGAKAPPAAPAMSEEESSWIALRAALVVMPAYLLALIDPSSYMAIVLKSVGLGQQSCTATVRDAARELIGSTLLGGLMAMLFWWALGLFVDLWMFFLWMLLFALLMARKLYGFSPTRFSPGFWLNSLVTMIILLGLSVQDSANGKDVYTAFLVRMALFIAISLYAWLMVYLLDQYRQRRYIRQPGC